MVFTFQRKWEKARLFPTGLERGNLKGMNPRMVPSLWVADPSAVNKLGSLWPCWAFLAPIPRPLLCFLLFLQQSHQFSQARSLPLFSLSPKSSPSQRGFSYHCYHWPVTIMSLYHYWNYLHLFVCYLSLPLEQKRQEGRNFVWFSCVFLYLIQCLAHSKCSLNIFCINKKIMINFLKIFPTGLKLLEVRD